MKNIAIVGAGPAGYSAAITAVSATNPSSSSAKTRAGRPRHSIANYPGRPILRPRSA